VGKPNKAEDTINIPLIKRIENNVEKVYRDPNGKEAITRYKLLRYSEKHNVSLLEVKILTGRTHQIRVHLKEKGLPILGDGKYGGKKAFVKGFSNKLHLHSYSLTIKNFYGTNVRVVAEPPEIFREQKI